MKKEKLYTEFENLAEKLGLRVIKGEGRFSRWILYNKR